MPSPARDTASGLWTDPDGGSLRLGYLDIASPYPEQRIGEILVSLGSLAPSDLQNALRKQANAPGPPLGLLLVTEGYLSRSEVASGLALQRGVRRVRITADALDAGLVDRLGADRCLRHGLVPWRQLGAEVIVATARPDDFAGAEPELAAAFGPVRMVIAAAAEIEAAVRNLRDGWLVRHAEARPPRHLSARNWRQGALTLTLGLPAAVLLAGLATAPVAVFAAGLALVTLALAAMTALRAAALVTAVRHGPPAPPPPLPPEADLPMISMLVPLLCEADITDHLLGHLARLDYPEDRLEILLITEAHDGETDRALSRGPLPRALRRLTVPAGTIRTKPRALNYALDFTRGDIVGVWDAEDAPDPDQLRRIAAGFAAAPEAVVCLQGVLDFYNPAQNLMSRWFALDYAAWFRVLLPGLARLGFALPLGGTTVFFRRPALEALGGWDAHNVTEDADLGIRLSRHGWRTDMVATVTREEANCLALPWIRQRTRWLKGYAVTWAVHMRNPRRLWRELGPKRFLGVQVMFLGTAVLFLGAPLLWTLWALPLGLSHPVADLVPPPAAAACIALYLLSQAVDFAAAALAVWRKGDRWLVKWTPGLLFYFPLATVASYRALAEIAVAPFYWDKTRHGLSRPAVTGPDRPTRSV